MPKSKIVNVKELSDLPLFLTINDIVEKLGYSRPEVDTWFKEKTFPVIKAGINKVNKYDLIEWLTKYKGNPRAKYCDNVNISDRLVDELRNLNFNINTMIESKNYIIGR